MNSVSIKALLAPAIMLLLLAGACARQDSAQAPAANQQPANGSVPTDARAASFKAMPGQSTPLHFAHLEMNFKPTVSGDTVSAIYPFKNMSQESVKIKECVTSCNCVQTKYPKGNIHPGQYGEIEVRFLTESQVVSRHEKIISVVMEGVDEIVTLRLNGQILPKP